MNYGKKDEDAENGLVKVDRTQVFQEGEHSLCRTEYRFPILVHTAHTTHRHLG